MGKISKQFKRLAILALGLSIALAGVLGIVHITQNDECAEYMYATTSNNQSVSIDANGILRWNSSTGSNTGNLEAWLQRRDAAGNWHRVGLLGRNTRAQSLGGTSGCCCSPGTPAWFTYSPPAASNLLPGVTGASWTDWSSRSGTVNLYGLTSHLGIGVHTLRVELREIRRSGSGGAYNLNGVRQTFGAGGNHLWLAGTTLTWTRSANLGVPNPTISGSTISWNAVANAGGYQLRRGTTVLRNLGAGTLSYNLAGMSAGDLAHGVNHTNLNVIATRAEHYWINSGASANVSWARRGVLATPTGVAVSGNNLTWTHGRANTTHFEIRRGNYVMATVPVGAANAHTFDLRRLPDRVSTNTQVGAYRALAVGAHSLTVVARNLTAGTLWDNSGVSGAAVYNRIARVDSVRVSAPNQGANNMMTLSVAWPRPLSVEQMPGVQLSAVVDRVHGTDGSVRWTSNRPSMVTVDWYTGFARAGWASDMWELSQQPIREAVITARSVFNNSIYHQFTILISFDDPPYPIAVGVAVDNAGLRGIELAPCGSALPNVTQFFASAYGFNLTSAMRGVTWSSSDTGVATIDRYTGMLTALSAGVTRITATSVAYPHVPSAFYVTIVRDGTAIATGVSIFCDDDRADERRLIIPYTNVPLPFVELRAFVEGHNIESQLVTWTSSCGASVGVPSDFLSIVLTSEGVRLTGKAAAGPLTITATPVNATGVVGTFRIFIDQLVAPSVTSISVGAPAHAELLIPVWRPLLEGDMPSTLLTATTVGGLGGGTGSAVVWSVYPLGFVELVVCYVDPNVVRVVAIDRGRAAFSQQVTVSATSVISGNMSASRVLTITQAALSGITLGSAFDGSESGNLFIPYHATQITERVSIDLRAIVGVSHSSVSQGVRWVAYPLGLVQFDNARTTASLVGGLDSLVTLRPLGVGVVTITAMGAYCETVSNVFELEIVQASPTSVRINGPMENASFYEMAISLPRPDVLLLPVIQLVASVGGSLGAASGLVWTSSCGGSVVGFLGSDIGHLVLLRGLNAGTATITATHLPTGFYALFTIIVDQATLYAIEILADNVVREETAMLIPLVYNEGVYELSEMMERQILLLTLEVILRGDVTTQFVWTSSDESVVMLSTNITNADGFTSALPYGVGRAIIRATSTIDDSVYAEFVIYVTRGTASCSIQDGILDLPTVEYGYVRVILVCENYFGAARMSHYDLSLEYAQNFVLPTLQIETDGAIFLGWSLSRGGSVLPTTFVSAEGENYDGESSTGGEYVILLPLHLLNLEYGADTLLLFAVWYIPYIPSDSNGSNLARNIIIGTLSVAGVGAAGTAGYIAQSKIRARRKENIDEWGMD